MNQTEGVSVRRIFVRSMSIIEHNLVMVATAALFMSTIPSVMLDLLARMPVYQSYYAEHQESLGVFSSIVSLFWGILMEAALLRSAVADELGSKADLGDSLRDLNDPKIPLTAIIISIASTVGLLLFVVPGIFILVIWSVAIPVLVRNEEGVYSSLQRSAALTSGARWKIMLLLFLGILFYFILSLVAKAILHLPQVQDAKGLWSIVAGTLVVSLTNIIWASIHCSLYVELVKWKEGSLLQFDQIYS